MGESDRSDEEQMNQRLEEVQEWAGQVVEALEIFSQGDPRSEGDRVEQWDNLQNLASDIMGECGAMVGGLQGRKEAIGRTRKCVEEIRRMLEDFCQLSEEEYGNRGEEVSAAVHEIIKEVEARLEKGEAEQAARVLRENWRRFIEALGGDGLEWEDWRRSLEEAGKKVKEAEEKVEQARNVAHKAKEEREKVLAELLWRNEQWEQARKEFGRSEEEQVEKPDVEALQQELETADLRLTGAEIDRKVCENELETARLELANWNPEFERMTQALGEARQLRAWVLAVSESDDAERELSKARRELADCELRQILAEGLYHLAAAKQGVDATERELGEAMEERETCEKKLKEAEEELRRCCLVADDPQSGQQALERCKEWVEKARLAALEECWAALEQEWKTLEEWEKAEQREREPLEKALGAWARLRLERAKDEWDGVMQELKDLGPDGLPTSDAVKALKSRVEMCEKELKAAKDMCPTNGPVELVLTLEDLERLVKSELDLDNCKEELERALHDSNEWSGPPQEASRRLGLAVQEWARTLQKAKSAGGGWERVRDAIHRAACLVEAGKQALSRARQRKEACQAVVKTGEKALQGPSLRSQLDEDEVRKCQEKLDQWCQESERWETEESKCTKELEQIESEVKKLFSAQEQLQRAKKDLAGAEQNVHECEDEVDKAKKLLKESEEKLKEANKKWKEAREKLWEKMGEKLWEKMGEKLWEKTGETLWEKMGEKLWRGWARKEWEEANKKCEGAEKKYEEANKKCEGAEKKYEEARQKVRECEGEEKETKKTLLEAQIALWMAEEKLEEANQKAEEARQKVQESVEEALQKAREGWEKVFERGATLLERPDFQSLERSFGQALTNTPWEPRPEEAEAWAAACKQYRNWKSARQKVVACEEAVNKRFQELREALRESEETCPKFPLSDRGLEEVSEESEEAEIRFNNAKEEWRRTEKTFKSADNAVKEATEEVERAGSDVETARKNVEVAENSRKDAEAKLEEAIRVEQEADQELERRVTEARKAKEEAERRQPPPRDRNKTEEQELEERNSRSLGVEQGDLEAAMEGYEKAVKELKEATEEPSEEAEEKLERAQRKVEVQNARVIGAAETSLEKAIAERKDAERRIVEAQEAKDAAEEAKKVSEENLEDKQKDYQRWLKRVEEARQERETATKNIKTTREKLQKARQELRDRRATLARGVVQEPVTSAAQNSLWTEEGYQKAREEWNKAWDNLKRAEEKVAGAETGLAKARVNPGVMAEEVWTTREEWTGARQELERAREKWKEADGNLEKARNVWEKINEDLETADKNFNQARAEWMRAWDNFQATSQALGASRQGGEYGDAGEDLEWMRENLEWTREDLEWTREPWHQARTKLVMFYGWQGTPAALPWPERVFEQAWQRADKAKKKLGMAMEKVAAAKRQSQKAERELKGTQARLEEKKKALQRANRELTHCEQSLEAARQRSATSAQAYHLASRRRRALEQLRILLNRVPKLETLRNENPAVDTASSSPS